MRTRKLTRNNIEVWRIYSDAASAEGIASIRRSKIAEIMGVSPTSVGNSLRALRGHGVLVLTRDAGGSRPAEFRVVPMPSGAAPGMTFAEAMRSRSPEPEKSAPKAAEMHPLGFWYARDEEGCWVNLRGRLANYAGASVIWADGTKASLSHTKPFRTGGRTYASAPWLPASALVAAIRCAPGPVRSRDEVLVRRAAFVRALEALSQNGEQTQDAAPAQDGEQPQGVAPAPAQQALPEPIGTPDNPADGLASTVSLLTSEVESLRAELDAIKTALRALSEL